MEEIKLEVTSDELELEEVPPIIVESASIAVRIEDEAVVPSVKELERVEEAAVDCSEEVIRLVEDVKLPEVSELLKVVNAEGISGIEIPETDNEGDDITEVELAGVVELGKTLIVEVP